MKMRITLSLAMAIVLTGCVTGQSEFSCGKPDGVTCMDSISVLEVTNDPALERALRARIKALDAAGVAPGEINPYEILAELKAMRAPVGPGLPQTRTLTQPINGPLPVLEPAKVVRIWIAPWIDRKSDLHLPGYIFSEITPRRWTIGESEIDDAPIVAPIQMVPEGPLWDEDESAEQVQ